MGRKFIKIIQSPKNKTGDKMHGDMRSGYMHEGMHGDERHSHMHGE